MKIDFYFINIVFPFIDFNLKSSCYCVIFHLSLGLIIHIIPVKLFSKSNIKVKDELGMKVDLRMVKTKSIPHIEKKLNIHLPDIDTTRHRS